MISLQLANPTWAHRLPASFKLLALCAVSISMLRCGERCRRDVWCAGGGDCTLRVARQGSASPVVRRAAAHPDFTRPVRTSSLGDGLANRHRCRVPFAGDGSAGECRDDDDDNVRDDGRRHAAVFSVAYIRYSADKGCAGRRACDPVHTGSVCRVGSAGKVVACARRRQECLAVVAGFQPRCPKAFDKRRECVGRARLYPAIGITGKEIL